MTDPKNPPPSFNEALEELEEILQRIEGEETDIDALAAELKRAAELLDLARGKLRRAEVEVTQIVETLDSGADAEDDGSEDLDQDPDDEPEDDEDGSEDDDIPF